MAKPPDEMRDPFHHFPELRGLVLAQPDWKFRTFHIGTSFYGTYGSNIVGSTIDALYIFETGITCACRVVREGKIERCVWAVSNVSLNVAMASLLKLPAVTDDADVSTEAAAS